MYVVAGLAAAKAFRFPLPLWQALSAVPRDQARLSFCEGNKCPKKASIVVSASGVAHPKPTIGKLPLLATGKWNYLPSAEKRAPTIERLVRPDLPICFGAQTLMPNCVIRSVPFFASSC
jgi:hypothetical protein